MTKNHQSFTPEFIQHIVDLYNTGGYSYPKLEREYGIGRSTISERVKQPSPIKISQEETVTLNLRSIEFWYNRKRNHSAIDYLRLQ